MAHVVWLRQTLLCKRHVGVGKGRCRCAWRALLTACSHLRAMPPAAGRNLRRAAPWHHTESIDSSAHLVQPHARLSTSAHPERCSCTRRAGHPALLGLSCSLHHQPSCRAHASLRQMAAPVPCSTEVVAPFFETASIDPCRLVAQQKPRCHTNGQLKFECVAEAGADPPRRRLVCGPVCSLTGSTRPMWAQAQAPACLFVLNWH